MPIRKIAIYKSCVLPETE